MHINFEIDELVDAFDDNGINYIPDKSDVNFLLKNFCWVLETLIEKIEDGKDIDDVEIRNVENIISLLSFFENKLKED